MAFTFKDFKRNRESNLPHYLVIGHPISHSLSPLMHQTALDHHGLQANYYAVDLSSDDLTDFISWCNNDAFLGCNITLPYKELLKQIVDKLDPVADDLGVINTIVKAESMLIGYNTDLYGFLQPLESRKGNLEGSTAIVFGTGGASKAVQSGLLSIGIGRIIFVTRNVSRLHNTDQTILESGNISYVDYSQWPSYIDDAAILINTTPLGMYPEVNNSPVNEEEMDLLHNKICYDLVYNPIKTRFLELAEKAGGDPINGLQMFIHQGSRSFNLWTGKSFPLELIYKKLQSHLY